MLDNKLEKIEILILDVDGVMTDGRITMDNLGGETKSFNVKDGYGIRMLIASGIDVAIITGRRSEVVESRARDLGIKRVYQGVSDKRSVCMDLLKEMQLTSDQACYMGDDLPDLPVLKYVGLPVAVADAVEEAIEAALYVTKRNGGDGAVREVCEMIMRSRGAWPPGQGA